MSAKSIHREVAVILCVILCIVVVIVITLDLLGKI